MTFDSGASRINMVIRLVGVVFLAIGATLTFFTYHTANSLVPQIVPVFYLGAVLLMVAGAFAIVIKYN
ncbi:MAG: hypothetical protein OK456_00010 [Thaumarchaeota archaeon]|nr:hypothetical protein [Nitrososphaerota archaeon]